MNDINGSTVPAALNVGLDRLAVESEKIAQEIANRFQGQNTFYRLNVEHGTDRHSHGKAVTLEEVVTQTNAYLRSAGISISVDALVGSLLYPFEVVIWSTTRENFEKAMDSYIRKAKERVEKLHIAEIKAAAQEIVETLEAIRVSQIFASYSTLTEMVCRVPPQTRNTGSHWSRLSIHT